MTRAEQMTFYRTHARRLFNISMRILRDSGAAEDVMQETILKYLTSDIQPLGEAKAAAWLNKACIRSSIDALRKNKREQLSLNEYAASEQAVEAESQQEDMTEVEVGRVKKAMAELKDPYRLILNLVLIEGLDYDEIAEVTGQSQGTIRTQFSRGKVKLLEILKRYDGTK
ncbi:MAG: RNA polymerase sigma factor [Bacteroidales bacterium]|nr:RNA polymerase sigma factor [Bacteroidales bacterium]